MASRKKLLTSVVALGTAAALVLGGTFAWQSINQTALNQSSDDVNPGGRLHDDFDGENKDVYVENFAEEPIFARIRLEEYLTVVMNYGGTAQTEQRVLGDEPTEDEYGNLTYPGKILTFTEDNVVTGADGTITVNAGYDGELSGEDESFYWWSWTMGSPYERDEDNNVTNPVYYMPTFNLNKDSLEADINGYYTQRGMITDKDLGNQYTDMKTYTAGTTEKGIEIFDADDNLVDEVMSDTKELSILQELAGEGYISINKDVTHTAAQIGDTKGLISMADWLALNGGIYSEETHSGYWVYDTDGWVYWSSPIQPHTTTGRLLDGIKLNHVMDDSWYYSINVVAQFVTADDVGNEENGRGFYDTTKGTAPTDNAAKLLAYMTGREPLTLTVKLNAGDFPAVLSVKAGDSVLLQNEDGSTMGNDALKKVQFQISGYTTTKGTDYTYEDGTLTLMGDKLQAGLCAALYFKNSDNESPDAWLIYEDADQITLNQTVTIGTVAALNEQVSMFYDDGTTPVSGLNDGVKVFGKTDPLAAGTDYTFADGKLTIINSDLKGKVLLARTNYTGLIYVEAD